jgi:hypothetical protein
MTRPRDTAGDDALVTLLGRPLPTVGRDTYATAT